MGRLPERSKKLSSNLLTTGVSLSSLSSLRTFSSLASSKNLFLRPLKPNALVRVRSLLLAPRSTLRASCVKLPTFCLRLLPSKSVNWKPCRTCRRTLARRLSLCLCPFRAWVLTRPTSFQAAPAVKEEAPALAVDSFLKQLLTSIKWPTCRGLLMLSLTRLACGRPSHQYRNSVVSPL